MALFRTVMAWAMVLVLAGLFSGCSGKKEVLSAHDASRYIRDHNLKELPRFDIPMEVNERVVAWMEYFQGAGRRHFERYLERSGRYIPLMTKILREQGLPADLVYISLIESGFSTSAYSRAAAVGPWQFISGTGRRYGMRNDGWIDERRDPIRATYAAAAYFRDLYNEFGDWYLAMAGYNAGEGRVRNAIEMTGSRNFWEMSADSRAFRAETRDYVPKFIAAAIMAKAPERFGFTNINYQQPLDFERATVESQTDVGVIARCAGVDEQTISDLNPHLVRGATPPLGGSFEVRIPRGTASSFKHQYAMLPPEERVQNIRYEAHQGDTIKKIARRFGISAQGLAEMNGIDPNAKLRRGKVITIPKNAAAMVASADDDDSSSSVRTLRHKVRKGETLKSIAKRYGVSTAQLQQWNGLGKRGAIHRGQTLKIRKVETSIASKGTKESRKQRVAAATTAVPLDNSGSTSAPVEAVGEDDFVDQSNTDDIGEARPAKEARVAKTYTVRKGDTIGGIAAKQGITGKQLMAMNDLTSPKQLKAGMKLTISGQAPKKAALANTTAVPMDGSAQRPAKAQKDAAGAKVASAKTHQVKSGDTIGGIAAKYGISTKQLMAMNNLKNPKALRAGQKLVVKSAVKAEAPKAASAEKPAPLTAAPVESRIEAAAPAASDGSLSDTIAPEAPAAAPAATPAQQPAAPAVQQSPEKPQPAAGVPIKLSNASSAGKGSSQAISYKVRDGETLWDIARKHKVTIAQLQKWNKLEDPSAVKKGATIQIRKE